MVLLVNPTSEQEITNAISCAAQGKRCRITPNKNTTELTSTQRKVLRYLAEGRCNKDIATKLNLQEQTVTNTLSLIYSKLGLKDRSVINYYWGLCSKLSREENISISEASYKFLPDIVQPPRND